MYRFGQFELSPETRLLTGAGTTVALTPKAFNLLELLVRRRPVVVSKEEIHDVLWPDTYVVEANIPNLVREIRLALADSAREPRYVRTVPGHGYAFHGAVEELGVGGPRREAPALCELVGADLAFRLPDGDHVLGRGQEADLRIRNATVSRLHARLSVRGSQVVVTDLGSHNGTFVRGQRLAGAAPLPAGQTLQVGEVVLRLQLLDVPSRTQTVRVAPLEHDAVRSRS